MLTALAPRRGWHTRHVSQGLDQLTWIADINGDLWTPCLRVCRLMVTHPACFPFPGPGRPDLVLVSQVHLPREFLLQRPPPWFHDGAALA